MTRVEGYPSYITKGTRLRITRDGEPDLFLVVDDVKPVGYTMSLTVHQQNSDDKRP